MLIFYFCLHTDEEDYDPFGYDPFGNDPFGNDPFGDVDDDYDSRRPHRRDLCEKCKVLGHDCREEQC